MEFEEFGDFEPIFSRTLNNPFRRCVVNCPSKYPPCPSCSEGESCSYISKSCDSCPKTICEKDPSSDTGSEESSGPNVGAIAGGVIGGVALLVVAGLVYWFCIRKRRKGGDSWDDEKEDEFGHHRRQRQSTAGSIASTVVTRASNVIQIAYIPGITNRSTANSPDLRAPPVPPVPATVGGNNQDQHYFMPGDIRDSVWSGMTEDDRKSISPSLARSSVATTIYRDNAIVSPMPAQQALRAKAAVVSVKSGSQSPSSDGSQTPAVPAITNNQMSKANAVATKLMNKNQSSSGGKLGLSSIVARSGVARPVNVTKNSRNTSSSNSTASTSTPTTIAEENPSSNTPRVVLQPPNNADYSVTGSSPNLSSDGSSMASSKGKGRESTQSAAVTEIEDSPNVKQSPFADPIKKKHSASSSTILGDICSSSRRSIDSRTDSGKNSSQGSYDNKGRPSNEGKRSASPFGDENEIKP